jgi:Bacterial Ig-like domain
VHPTRQAPRSSTVHLRAIVAAALALALVLLVAALAWAAPVLSIDSGPSGPTNDRTPLFGFTVDVGATVECSIVADQATPEYDSCTGASTHTAALADGSYVFYVRATDDAGNQKELTRSFVVDTIDPAVDVVSGPTVTRDATPSFGFTAEAGATVQCSVDQGTPAYGSCSDATTHRVGAPLPDGRYTFRVRATDRAGNQAGDSQAFTVDSEAPTLSIDSGPAGPTSVATPSFGFSVEVGATVQCSVDQGTPVYRSCTSATTHVVGTSLPDGRYTFRVRATDGVGNQARALQDF